MGGVFTATLLDALTGGASEEDGRITGETLKAYLYENMKGFLSSTDLVRERTVLGRHQLVLVPSGRFLHCDQVIERRDQYGDALDLGLDGGVLEPVVARRPVRIGKKVEGAVGRFEREVSAAFDCVFI